MHRAAAEMLIHQFQSEPTNGIVHTGDPKDRVNRWTLARRFREFCREQFPELDDFELWNWYRHYLIQTGWYARREDGNVQWFTGFRLVVPMMKYQHATRFKPRPKVELVRYDPSHDTGSSNGHRRMN